MNSISILTSSRRKRPVYARGRAHDGRRQLAAGATIVQPVPELMFSPLSVAEAIRGVYTLLLARDA
jgi:hypothetical protein